MPLPQQPGIDLMNENNYRYSHEPKDGSATAAAPGIGKRTGRIAGTSLQRGASRPARRVADPAQRARIPPAAHAERKAHSDRLAVFASQRGFPVASQRSTKEPAAHADTRV